MRLGYHLSVAGGLVKAVQRAEQIGCECLQIFARNARGWASRQYPEREVETSRAALRAHDLAPLVIHSNYLVNLASANRALREKSLRAVADDLARADLLGAGFVVTHSGHAVGEDIATGLKRLARSVRGLLREVPGGGCASCWRTAQAGSGIWAAGGSTSRSSWTYSTATRAWACVSTPATRTRPAIPWTRRTAWGRRSEPSPACSASTGWR